jgi:hypothetical protein
VLEGLEQRLLLYSTLGGQWTYGSRITYSFVPDGTSVGGTPSVLFQTLNAKYATATWEQQLQAAASIWENVTGINLALVSDGGQPLGTSGNQQDDPRFGDIRIAAIPLPSGTLAETFLPPPMIGGTDAGDILLNSTVNWQINSSYDLMTVAAHEIGHALGLGESSVSTAVMYGTYNGIKQALACDDISGIQSIYGTRPYDQFNTNCHRNNLFFTATNITSYIDGNAQIAIGGLDNTTTSDVEWYTVTVPAVTNGTMTVTVQSSNLSSLSPKFMVYTSALSLVNQASAPNSFGATISTTASVSAGQSYYIKVMSAGGQGPVGSYGLLVNFGSKTQPPIAPPNTVVASQRDQGGGTTSDAWRGGAGSASGSGGGSSEGSPGIVTPVNPGGTGGGSAPITPVTRTMVGGLEAWITAYTVAPLLGPVVGPINAPSNPVPVGEPGPAGPAPVGAPVSPIPIVAGLPGGPVPGPTVAPAAATSSSGADGAVHSVAWHRSFRNKSRFAGQHRSLTHSLRGPMRHVQSAGLGGTKSGAATRPL